MATPKFMVTGTGFFDGGGVVQPGTVIDWPPNKGKPSKTFAPQNREAAVLQGKGEEWDNNILKAQEATSDDVAQAQAEVVAADAKLKAVKERAEKAKADRAEADAAAAKADRRAEKK